MEGRFRYSDLKSASRLRRPTDVKRVYRYLCGETSQKPTSWQRRQKFVPGHNFRVARHSLITDSFDPRGFPLGSDNLPTIT